MAAERQAVVIGAKQHTPRVREVTFRMVDPPLLQYRAGQYIILRSVMVGEKLIKRAYSIACPPRDPATFSLCVRRVLGGPSSNFVHTLQEGDPVEFSGPWGKFTCPDVQERDLTFVATGTGFSPVRALTHDLLRRGCSRRITFYWGLREERDLFCLEELRALAAIYPHFTFTIALSRPNDRWPGPVGRVTDLFRSGEVETEGREFYLAGNGAMIGEVEEMLLQRKVLPEAIHKEVFFKPAETPARV
jgi:ferredoxin-NADP reductase